LKNYDIIKLKIGVIGCGTIGAEICKAIDEGIIEARLVAVYDRSIEHCGKMIGKLKNKPAISSIDELIKSVDVVVECASQEAVREHGLTVLENGKDLMVMSVGAMLDSELLNNFIRTATNNRCRIYIPSGAIAGIDRKSVV
jgi:aspartate dehydrogenase